MNLTLEAVLTVTGAVGAAALITGFIAILKNLRGIGPILDRGNEPTASFVLSGFLVLAAFISKGAHTADGAFTAVIALYAIATIAMGIHDQVAARLTPDGAA